MSNVESKGRGSRKTVRFGFDTRHSPFVVRYGCFLFALRVLCASVVNAATCKESPR